MTLNSIIANFQTFKLADLLDIVIIAFLIYQLLGIINRTRAGQLAKGALLVLAVYLVANVLNMRTVTWLLNSLLQVGLLTLVAQVFFWFIVTRTAPASTAPKVFTPYS